MQYFKQIISEMRQQPVIGAVTVIGTSLAIFLIMVVVMMQEVKVTPLAPESNRDRFLHARFYHNEYISGNGFGGSGTISYQMAQRLYGDLENADTTTYFTPGTFVASANVHGQVPVRVDMRNTDAAYWRVFDFRFIDGAGFTADDVTSHSYKAVITESLARQLFGTEKAKGKEFKLDYYTTCTVCGVVRDVPTITTLAYAQMWLPLTENQTGGLSDWFGPIHTTILARDNKDIPKIKEEVNRRVEALNTSLKSENSRMVDHGAPYTQEALPLMRYSNTTPEVEKERTQRILIYTILLLIPAINLSSMTHSRLRQRISEIGVRRAFGCTRFGIIRNLLGENMIITLAGGLIGFLSSLLFAWLAADMLFSNHYITNTDTGLTPMMLINTHVFLMALGFCFLLNLLTAGIPAWRAARLNPVEAISCKR